MPITYGSGNLLTEDADALVNTVNTQGIMGKGIALQFKKAWPSMFKDYEAACKRGDVVVGRMHIWETGQMTGPRFIINFPTKRHWRSRSRLSDIEDGLVALASVIRTHGIRSIAVPPLGCGNGGLDWDVVEPAILAALSPLANEADITIFPPEGAPVSSDQILAEPRPNLTPARASLLALMRDYERSTLDPPSLIATQKLAYFLQNSGQPLRLHFQPHTYGPYADDLRKALRTMEGHFITGFGDGSTPVRESELIRVKPEAEAELDRFVADHPDTQRRITRVLRDIEGFESDYGLELLATVHWIASHDALTREDGSRVHDQVRNWSQRKVNLFTEAHVQAALSALHDRDLLSA